MSSQGKFRHQLTLLEAINARKGPTRGTLRIELIWDCIVFDAMPLCLRPKMTLRKAFTSRDLDAYSCHP